MRSLPCPVERLAHLRQDLGHRELRKLRADLATSTTTAADAALPAPTGFSGFTPTSDTTATTAATTTTPPQPLPVTSDATSHLEAETRNDTSLDLVDNLDAPADQAPAAPTKFTPQLLPSAQLLPTVTASEIAKRKRRDKNLKRFFADTKLARNKRKFPECSVVNNLLIRTFKPKRGPRAGHTTATIFQSTSMRKRSQKTMSNSANISSLQTSWPGHWLGISRMPFPHALAQNLHASLALA